MPEALHGLSSVSEVEALADQLSACADEIHARLMTAIKKRTPAAADTGGIDEGIDQVTAQSLLDSEVALREQANGVYIDAAACVVARLGTSQQHIMALTDAAKQTLRRITLVGDFITLVADLLMLAGAAASGQAAPIIKALQELKEHAAKMDTDGASAKPATG